MTKRTTGLFTRWKPIPDQISDQFRLEQQLNQITDACEFGPVPGAYFPMYWSIRVPFGDTIPPGIIASYCLPTGYKGLEDATQPNTRRTWVMVPVFISVFIDQGSVDFAIATSSEKVVDGAAPSGFRLQQGEVIHPAGAGVTGGVTIDINPNPVPPDVPWNFDFFSLVAPPPDPELGVDFGVCQKWEQAVDFPVNPVPSIGSPGDQLQLQVVNVMGVVLMSVMVVFKQVSKVDNYNQG